jgi:hypothetical protein
MSVFLRWGIFGILGIAAVMYAYNTSKHLAETRSNQVKPGPASDDPRETAVSAVPDVEPVPTAQPAPQCQAELEVAQRALEARRQGEPIDRLLRIQEIAFQAEPRRQRLEAVARRWYQLEGNEPAPEALSLEVVDDCERFSPAP